MIVGGRFGLTTEHAAVILRAMDHYSAKVACAVGKLTYRQLDYMIRDGFFASALPAKGKGTARGFSFRNLLALRCIGSLRAADVSLQATRKVDRALRAFGRDFVGAHLVVTGSGARREVYVRSDGELLALLRDPGQTAACVVLDLDGMTARLREDVEAAVIIPSQTYAAVKQRESRARRQAAKPKRRRRAAGAR